MTPSITELEATAILFSLLVFALFTLIGMLSENDVSMDLPFSAFELTFITIAFFVFSLYSLASIYIQPSAADSDVDFEALESKAHTKKQRVITREAKWRP